ncbi:DUF2188 domain-containing protein [Cellulomonas xylanilytica]|uniref:DUF2188 domain-containing protein n=1 Tax=Cellulomonas xylanilytica TaxID=233583 RepID=A0A510V1X4_9CELL|nr:DUF2188 domain-containing protein [Cellulomonas xylanilytica]GEK20902.1 hypothetical protein CXY01_14220 [Cellulomonas xylanilytica]
MSSSVHTVHKDGMWINEVQGEPVDGGFLRKEDAVRAGRDAALARGAEHAIHNLDGTIAEKNSYGNDPRNVPG